LLSLHMCLQHILVRLTPRGDDFLVTNK
jgi:hypothetical protein